MKQFLQIIGLLVIVSCQSDDKQSIDRHENENLPGLIENAPPDTTIHFLWREDRQTDSNENVVSTILINKDYSHNIPDAERAALGYVATFIGSECAWDGEATDERNNLQCKVLTALNLGYQCSDKHLGFLRSWFARDSSVLSQLEDSNCPTTPYTATIQNTFDEINLSRRGNNLEISFKAEGMNMRAGQSWSWTEKDYFHIDGNSIQLMKVDKSDVDMKAMRIGEGG